jgi:hypothetical protein
MWERVLGGSLNGVLTMLLWALSGQKVRLQDKRNHCRHFQIPLLQYVEGEEIKWILPLARNLGGKCLPFVKRFKKTTDKAHMDFYFPKINLFILAGDMFV